jgi:hypothetical protein
LLQTVFAQALCHRADGELVFADLADGRHFGGIAFALAVIAAGSWQVPSFKLKGTDPASMT